MEQQQPFDNNGGYSPYEQGYAPPPPPMPHVKKEGRGFGIASIICGMAAVTTFLLFINIPLILGAVIFGVIQLVFYRKRTLAIIGIAAACLSAVLMVTGYGLIARGMVDVDSDSVEEFRQQLENDYYYLDPDESL